MLVGIVLNFVPFNTIEWILFRLISASGKLVNFVYPKSIFSNLSNLLNESGIVFSCEKTALTSFKFFKLPNEGGRLVMADQLISMYSSALNPPIFSGNLVSEGDKNKVLRFFKFPISSGRVV